jgi:hypothetical protein
MRISIAIATFLVVGAGAAGVAAITSGYQGSDALLTVSQSAFTSLGFPASNYIGGGAANGIAAEIGTTTPFPVASASQQTTPSTRLTKSSDANLCSFNNATKGAGLTSSSNVVIGLDAVDVFSSITSGGSSSCNGTADNTGTGLAYSGTTGVFTGSNATQNWKWILALIYGGRDLSPGGSTTADCTSAARKALVANWSLLFENGCANGNTACAASGPTGGALWHAFRRDDDAGTADVFASLIGLSPSNSNSLNNGFGASPFCNAINWDITTANANCALGAFNQFTGPGGINDPNSTTTPPHRRPPPGTWGDNPDPTQGALGADVLPTQFQDNDPIRRPCLGGSTNNPNRAGEEVCNIDGALGLVQSIVASDFIPGLPSPGNQQYATNACNTFVVGKPATVFTCAIRGTGTKHSGECPNGDALIAGGCLVPIDSINGTSQCVATKATVAALQNRTLGSPEGRHYNVQIRDGSVTEPSVGYVQYKLVASGTSLDFAGGYYRIHQVETAVGNLAAGCQYLDADDTIACLTQADPCSIGFATDGGRQIVSKSNPGAGSRTLGAVDSVRVAQIYPTATTVQLLGQAGEYQYARKLYLNSLVGFQNIAATTGDPQAADELTFAKFESTSAINPILTSNSFFTLGAQFTGTPAGGTDPQFAEDFNEQLNCNNTATAPANVVGYLTNPAGVPNFGTTCGDGVRGPYEECDNGTLASPANGHATGNSNSDATAGGCSIACRCNNSFVAGNCD